MSIRRATRTSRSRHPGVSPPDCTVRTATSATRTPVPAPSASIPRSAPARPAAASAAASASITAWSSRTLRLTSAPGRRQTLANRVLQGMPGGSPEVRPQARHPDRHALARPDRCRARLGASTAKASGPRMSGTACADSLPGSRPRRTRCTFECCCRATGRTPNAAPAAARGSSPRPCCGGSAIPDINIREMMLLPIDECRRFFAALELPAPLDEAADLLLREIRTRLQVFDRCRPGLS